MKEFKAYIESFKSSGGLLHNVRNIAAHWLYGTDPMTLASLSQRGLVYSPPGH